MPIFYSENGNLYFGVGIGLYIKSKTDIRVGSKVTFGERFFVGYTFKNFSLEMYWKHYSNGTLKLPNSGHDFGGLSFGYNF
ncbi:acyloxyacyl hydrolase [Helicobacter enhydrae]|uniref:acyloxyacyl hydrolase n=1 Tax=Helicobacter enhydrae TaxID=222136 RepID=UPI0019010813|nr:acyloxyacyl hydrolase [Helicobacter enhydrae]